VVTGDEVDTLFRLALLVAVDLGAADDPVRHAPHRPVLAAEEVADVVAESAIPLLPGVPDEAPDLVETGRVPRLGNELRAGEGRVGLDVPEYRRVRQRLTVRIAGEDRRQVEAEAVDMHFLDPVAETVHDHPPNHRVVGIEGVPAAG